MADGANKGKDPTGRSLDAKAKNDSLEANTIQYATAEPGKFVTDPHDKEYMEMTLAGQHGEIVKKIIRQRIEQRAKEFPRWPSQMGAGVRILWAESRFWYDRERLSKDFTDEWRAYRVKYLQSLELDPREPVHVPEYERALIHPIRRFYERGGDWIQKNVIHKFTDDKYKATNVRITLSRACMAWFFFMGCYYTIRYNRRTWESNSGPLLMRSAPIIYPSHPHYPFKEYKIEPGQYDDPSFSRRKVYKDLRDYEDNTVVL